MSRNEIRNKAFTLLWPVEDRQSESAVASTRRARWYRPLYTFGATATTCVLAPEIMPNKFFQLAIIVSVVIIAWDHAFIIGFYRSMVRKGAGRASEGLGQSRLVKYLSLLFCGIIMGLLANIIMSPIPSPHARYETVPVSLGSLLILGVLPSLYAAAMKIGFWIDSRPRATHALFVLCVFSVITLLQVTIATSIYSIPTWDPSYVLSNAFALANGSHETIDSSYFANYPNNITLTLLLAAFNRMMFVLGVPNLLLASILLNNVVLLIGILLTYLAARRLAGTGAAVFSLLPSGLFVVLSPWMTVPYSDTFGLIFVALLVYLYVRAHDAAQCWPRVALWTAMGFVGAVGYSIKPTVVLALASIVAVTLAPLVKSRGQVGRMWPAVALSFVLVSAFAVGAASLMHIETSSRTISFDRGDNADAVPLTHFLKMGAQGHGGYNEQDVTETLAIADPGERFRSGLDSYRQRVEAMGPIGYADFLRRKAVWTLGDGTFFAWSEGPIATQEDPFLSKDPVSREIQSYLWVKGENFPFVTGTWQSFWLATLFLVALPVLLHRDGNLFSNPAGVMRISLLGLLLFLMLFETRSRYLFLYLPFFILLMVLTMDSVLSHMRKVGGGVKRPPNPSSPR